MKVGRQPGEGIERVRVTPRVIGSELDLHVDANGAYARKLALDMANSFLEHGISLFEETVSETELDGLRLLGDRGLAGMALTSGEQGYDLHHFSELLTQGCVDVLQIDVSRFAGITGFARAAALADAQNLPVSSHTTPSQHVHVCGLICRGRATG